MTAVKGIISAGLILFLLYRLDIALFLTELKNIPLWAFPVIVGAFAATVLIGGWRWSLFVHPFGRISYWKLSALYFVGYFFNNFFPSGVGGDVVRGYIAGKELDKSMAQNRDELSTDSSMSAAYSSVVAERVAGMMATVFISLIALPFVVFKPQVVYPSIALNAGLWICVLLFLLLPSENFVKKLFVWLPLGLGDKLYKFVKMLRSYRKSPASLAMGFISSIIYQGAIILVVMLTGELAGAELSPAFYFATVPLVWVISLLPISLNALGVREASFAFFFSLYGASESAGFLVSLVFFGASLVCGLFGGIIFAFWNSASKKMPDNPNRGELCTSQK